MLKRNDNRFTLTLIAADLACTLMAFYFARVLRQALPFGVYLNEALYANWLLYPIIAILWVAVFVALEIYAPTRTLRYLDDVQAVVIATTVAVLLFAGVAYLFFRELSRFLFAYFYLLDAALLIAWRALLRLLFRLRPGLWSAGIRRVLIVGGGPTGHEIAQALHTYRWARLELIGFVDDFPLHPLPNSQSTHFQSPPSLPVPFLGPISLTQRIVRERHVDEVIIALPLRAHEQLMDLVLKLQELPVNIRLVPDILDLVFIRASVEEFAGLPLIGLREPIIDGIDRLLKRAFDLAAAGLGLVLASPLMLLTAWAIKLDSPGPALFLQQRVGEGGKLFWMIKFRTMAKGAEEQELELAVETEEQDRPPLFDKRPDDPRVTRLGHLLRRASLDELPQLINVLLGEMSLVGPRPELPWLVERYQPWQRKRFAVPQGITGWWQVNGRSNKAAHDLRVEDDLYYIRNYSLLLDLRILWKTIRAVIRGEGAF